MFAKLIMAMYSLLVMSAAVVHAEAVAPADTDDPASRAKITSVEIFANQLPILIGRGQPKSVVVTGSVYDSNFSGDIIFAEASPGSCPIFDPSTNLGNRFRFIPGNTANVAIASVLVFVPANMALGTYTCTLRYEALLRTFVAGIGDVLTPVGKGNPVSFQYTVKNRLQP